MAQVVETHTFNGLNRLIPDGNPSGLAEFQSVSSSIVSISQVRVSLEVAGEFNGDLYGYLVHSSGFSVLLNRPGKTASHVGGYGDAGLDVTFEDGAVNGDLHGYQSVTTPIAGSPLTGAWAPDARNVDPDDVLDTDPRTADLSVFNGLGADGEWVLFLVDLETGGTNMLVGWELEITGIDQPTVTWNNPADIIYGTALDGTQLNATTGVAGSFSYDPAADTVLDAGEGQELTVVFTPDDLGSYAKTTNTVAINVIPAPLTISAVGKSKVFGEALPAFTADYSGFVNGDDETDLDVDVALDTVATDTSPVGSYTITASGASDPNYDITHIEGTLAIDAASTSSGLIASANPVAPGASLTLTMTVSPVAPGAGVPTGNVQFLTNGVAFGSPAALAGGVAALTTSTLPLGSHTVTAEYAGDGNFLGSSVALGAVLVVNSIPVAGDNLIERYPSGSVKVSIATLLANDTDADGDTLTLVSVSSPTSNSGGVVIADGWVHYTPAVGFTNVDSFTYTIEDGRGGSATGTVTVDIINDTAVSGNLSIVDQGDGSYRVRFRGMPDRTYTLEYAETLTPPDWASLAEITTDATGAAEYIDTPPGGAPGRFYRTSGGFE